MPNLPREPLLHPGTLKEIKEIYKNGGELFVDGVPAKAINDFEGYDFTEFINYVEGLSVSLKSLASSTAFKAFPKVFFDAYLARFSVNGTVQFSEIENRVKSLSLNQEQAVVLDTQGLDSLVSRLNSEIENNLISMDSKPDEFNTVEFLTGGVFPRLVAILDETAKDQNMAPICENIKSKIIKLKEVIIQSKNKDPNLKGILVDHRQYEPKTMGREIRLKQSYETHMFLERQKPALILAVLQEKINNDPLLPFTDLNAEIKILNKFNSLTSFVSRAGWASVPKNTQYEFTKYSKIVKGFNINREGLIDQSYKMFSTFLPSVGIEATPEKFLLLNKFFYNKKGESQHSPIMKNTLFPVVFADGTQRVVLQTAISLKQVVKKAGASFEEAFKTALVNAFQGQSKNIVVKDSAGFISKTAIAHPDGVSLTSEGVEDARLNAHADLVVQTEDGKNLYFSLKKESFGYLSGTNLERGKKDLRHEEIMKSPLGRRWYSDIAQFNSDIGAIFAASLPEVLRQTEKNREKIINEFSAYVLEEYGQQITGQFANITVASLKEYADEMIKQGSSEETNKIVKQLIGKINTIRESQSIGAMARVTNLETILIKQEFRLWRMIYEQTLESKCLFGEERDSVKAGLGFENVSHFIVGMPKFTDKGGTIIIEPDPANKQQFVVANKNFKAINPVQSTELVNNSQAAIYKYADFFKKVLPVMLSRKQGGKTTKKFLDIEGLGCETVPVKELDQKGTILESPEATSSFGVIIDAGKKQDRNQYIMGLKELSNTLNEKFQQDPDSPLIRIESLNPADKQNLVNKIDSAYATSYKINLVIAFSLMDSKVNIGNISIALFNNNKKLVKESLVKMAGLMNNIDFALIENIVVPKEPVVPQDSPVQPASIDIQKMSQVILSRVVPKLKQQLFAVGEGVAKKELANLKQNGINEAFSYNVQVAIDTNALLGYITHAVK